MLNRCSNETNSKKKRESEPLARLFHSKMITPSAVKQTAMTHRFTRSDVLSYADDVSSFVTGRNE